MTGKTGIVPSLAVCVRAFVMGSHLLQVDYVICGSCHFSSTLGIGMVLCEPKGPCCETLLSEFQYLGSIGCRVVVKELIFSRNQILH